MEKVIDKLKEELSKGSNIVKFKGEISGANWVEMDIISLDKTPITLGTPINNIKFSFQSLISGAKIFTGPYRMDNHLNKPLHQHFSGSESFVDVSTLSGALLIVLGSNYFQLESLYIK